jgi:Holliday junction resolvase RusA-like endonuclease
MQSKKKTERRKIVRFKITPQTNVRATQGDRVFFRIKRDKLRPAGLKRLLRLERYNEYKLSIWALAKQHRFDFPNQGCWIRFYIPCPKSWSKKKKARFHGYSHLSKPDLDNLTKAVFDSLFPEDKNINHFQASKQWVNSNEGWIEFEISDPIFPEITSI